ncbi:hypothetical protein FNU76_02725 [Chitinimonas arctica]|uniref:Uncharacterized protein n=1 Tax=Chitinimonas arctica TaxID=2594795 RepID=A0A516SB35_9NEIS|nr:hypothetical protein [Chitinimonas arctica]QDQ25353.1 hypothetical protein FNU76_02725 [Chitinimonas arctica]
MKYTRNLSAEAYSNFVMQLISGCEGHITRTRDIGDGKATVGWGYTFNRSNNVAIWRSSGISLTEDELGILKKIDEAKAPKQTALAIATFPRNISRAEGQALLLQTYPQYEVHADGLNMPFSPEPAFSVSLSRWPAGTDELLRHQRVKFRPLLRHTAGLGKIYVKQTYKLGFRIG